MFSSTIQSKLHITLQTSSFINFFWKCMYFKFQELCLFCIPIPHFENKRTSKQKQKQAGDFSLSNRTGRFRMGLRINPRRENMCSKILPPLRRRMNVDQHVLSSVLIENILSVCSRSARVLPPSQFHIRYPSNLCFNGYLSINHLTFFN